MAVESFGVEAEVNIERAHMRHALLVQKQPWHSPTNDHILASIGECRA